MENQRPQSAAGSAPNPEQQPSIDPGANVPAQDQAPAALRTNPPAQALRQQKPARRRGTARDLVMAILAGVMCFIMTDSFLWTGTLGMGFAIGAVLFLAVEIWYLAPVIRCRSTYGAACILLIAAGCVSLVFSADHLLKLLTLLCLILLTTCLLMESMELRAWEPGSFRAIGDYFYVGYAASFGRIGAGMYGLFHCGDREKTGRRKRVGRALLGLAIALPLVLLLAVLLYSGDDAFSGMLDGIRLGELPERLLSLILAVPVFIPLFSRLFSLRELDREPRRESGKGFDPVVLTFFLLGISLIYLAYLFSQLAYFFNGFLGFLPEDFTYAQYARRGFFELMAVSAINIVIVILCAALCGKKEGKLPMGVKLTSLFLCCFSLVLVLTEIAKMKMYMDSYGLTRLRILTTLFTVFLAVIFLALIVRLFVREMPYMKIAVLAGAAMVIALSFLNLDGVIARYNVQAYRDGTLKTIDVHTITELNDAAVLSLLELAADNDPEIAKAASDDLYRRWEMLHGYDVWGVGELKDYDWRGFNLTTYRARALLLENEALILGDHSAYARYGR